MSYATVEAAVLTTLRSYSGAWEFTAQNSSRGDYTVKDAYSGGPAVVIRQGGPSQYGDEIAARPRRGSHGKQQERHLIYLDCFTPRSDGQGGDQVAYVVAQELSDALIAHMGRYPTLGGACIRCEVIAAATPAILEKSNHVFQRLTLRADAESTIDLAPGEALR